MKKYLFQNKVSLGIVFIILLLATICETRLAFLMASFLDMALAGSKNELFKLFLM